MPETATQEEVIAAIKKLNHNRYVTGILPMMPMPKHIDGDAVGAAITMSKDVDCLNPKSVGEVFLGAAAGHRALRGPVWRLCLITVLS